MEYLLTPIAAFFVFAWFIRTGKSLLFWAYLMQLKEYKWKRFVDHFRTEKGRGILFDKILFTKIFTLLGLIYLSEFVGAFSTKFTGFWLVFGALMALYTLESVLTIKKFQNKTLKLPIFTKNASAVAGLSILTQVVFLLSLAMLQMPALRTLSAILAFDILSPLIVILIVYILKPLDTLQRKKLFDAARKKRESLKDLLVIGIVGSYGKTSTKEFLYEILKNKFKVIKTAEHQNTDPAVARLILNELKPEHEIFICEMGAYEEGDIADFAKMVQPKIGVFLGANEQHLSLFGTMERLLRGEGGEELLEALPKGSLGVWNGNNKYAYELYKKAPIAKRITYVPNLIDIINPEKRDVRAENINVKKDSIAFKVLTNKNSKGVEFKANLLGAHNVENILIATAVAEELGLTLQEIAQVVKTLKPLERAMTLSKNSKGINVVDSTYSSNPTAVKAHLEYLKVWGEVKKAIVMPCLIELGSESVSVHKQIGKQIGEVCDIAIVTTKEQYEAILAGAERSQKNTDISLLESANAIKSKLENSLKKGDVLLLEGRLNKEIIDKLKE